MRRQQQPQLASSRQVHSLQERPPAIGARLLSNLRHRTDEAARGDRTSTNSREPRIGAGEKTVPENRIDLFCACLMAGMGAFAIAKWVI